MKRTVALVCFAALAFIVSGCSDSSKLEGRVAKLESENAALRSEQREMRDYLDAMRIALAVRIKGLDQRTWMNDRALMIGVASAQYDIQCGPNPDPNCHLAAGFPGTVSFDAKRRRLSVTPWP